MLHKLLRTSLITCTAVLPVTHGGPRALQVIAAIISAAVPVDGGRGWTSFGLLLFELNLIVWAGELLCFERSAAFAIETH